MVLLDAQGREIEPKAKPDSKEHGVSGVRDRFSNYPSRGLTPSVLTAILEEADRGDVWRQSELYEEMEEKDAHLGAVLQTRKLAVAGLPWEVAPASDSSEDKKIAEFVREALGWIGNWDEALMAMLDAIGKGFSASELMWEASEEKVWVTRLLSRHQKRFAFFSKDFSVLDFPRLITDADPVYGSELAMWKWVFHRYTPRSGAVPRGGVLRPCAWMYLFKNYTLKDWVVFNERYAMPMRVGKYGPGAGEEERKVLRNAVMNLGSDAAAVISESTVIEIVEQAGRTGSVQAFERAAGYLDRGVTKAVLGHTGSADSTPGRLGGEDEAKDVRRDLLEADARSLAKTVRMQVIWPLVGFNFGFDRSLPSFRFLYEQGEDVDKKAERYERLVNIGMRIPQSHLHEEFGIPVPEEGEAVAEPRAQATLLSKSRDALSVMRNQPKAKCSCGQPHPSPITHHASRPSSLSLMAMAAVLSEDDRLIERYMDALRPTLEKVSAVLPGRIERQSYGATTVERLADVVLKVMDDAYSGADWSAIDGAIGEMYRGAKRNTARQVGGSKAAAHSSLITHHPSRSLFVGASPSVDIIFGGPDVRAVEFLSKLDSWYLSKLIKNPTVQESVRLKIEELYLSEGEGLFGRGDAGVEKLKSLISSMTKEISTTAVRRIVDTAVVRTRNWASTSQMHDFAIPEIEIYEPTEMCEFCQAMNGQVISVDGAYEQVQAQAGMTPEEYEAAMKEAAERFKALDVESFVASGAVPPYHPNCRGRVIKKI